MKKRSGRRGLSDGCRGVRREVSACIGECEGATATSYSHKKQGQGILEGVVEEGWRRGYIFMRGFPLYFVPAFLAAGNGELKWQRFCFWVAWRVRRRDRARMIGGRAAVALKPVLGPSKNTGSVLKSRNGMQLLLGHGNIQMVIRSARFVQLFWKSPVYASVRPILTSLTSVWWLGGDVGTLSMPIVSGLG